MSDKEWAEKFKHLYKVEVKHIDKEEKKVFAQAREKFSDQEAEEIGLQMLELKDNMRIRSEQLLEEEQHIVPLLIIER